MSKKFVLTHIKADFDAISSAWAAYKLHQCDAVFISSEPEANVISYFNNNGGMPKEIVHMKPKEISELSDIDTLYIVDCRQKKRLGDLEVLLEKADNIVIYDHHPIQTKDIASTTDIFSETGACVSMILKELFDRNMPITKEEATLYALGVYEDTGMLTFSSTKSEDALVVAKLIECKADLSVIRDYTDQEFTREQIFILNELLMNMNIIDIDGVEITISWASLGGYIDNLSVVASRMMDIQDIDVLFILVRNGPVTFLVARSRNSGIDVSKVAARFGGGGHSGAASASIRDMMLHEAVETLKVTIRDYIKPVRFLRELMNCPAKSMSQDATFEEAFDFAVKHNLHHFPVTLNEKTVGIISREDILQGIKHGLAKDPISLLMQVEFEVFAPDTPFKEAESVFVISSQKLLPIECNEKLIGVVTRTDVLRLMHEISVERSTYEERARAKLGLATNRNVAKLMEDELDDEQFSELKVIGETGLEEGVGIYIAGGFVRDLLMGLRNHDMDIVVEGDAIDTAMAYARKKNLHMTVHNKYKTATVHLPSGNHIDFATARTEYYNNPGAAPTVESSSLKNDLMRRDFTINAMAIRLDGNEFGRLIDYFSGQRDILDKKIRVLHSLSFVDDPTRAFRAIRFAARYGFNLGSHTQKLMKHAEKAGLFAKINGSKIFIEIKYILCEEKYFDALTLLKKYQMLTFIFPGLSIDANREKQFRFLESFYEKTSVHLPNVKIWMVRLTTLLNDCAYADLKNALQNMRVESSQFQILMKISTQSKYAFRTIKSMKQLKPSALFELMSKLSNEEILMLAVLLGEAKSYVVTEFLEYHRHMRIELNGNDLEELGVKPSKQMGEILKELRDMRIDGEITSKAEEIAYVIKRISAE